MKTEYILLKETPLHNNCPECYANDGLVLSFKQQRLFSRFMIKSKNQAIEYLYCKKCETDIFPGRWTDDIERVYEYHKKTIVMQSPLVQFTTTFYVAIAISLLCIGIIIALLLYPEIIDF